jgi:alkylation response protein AidB-like acyl-CoA dehydrogenase
MNELALEALGSHASLRVSRATAHELGADAVAVPGAIGEPGRRLADDPVFRRKLTEIDVELTALEYTELRLLAAENAGKAPGVEVSMLKIRGTEIHQRMNELALEALGSHASLRVSRATAHEHGADAVAMPGAIAIADSYFNLRKLSIFGGSNEIQRNILAKAVLGL